MRLAIKSERKNRFLKRLGLISEESFDPDKYFVGKKLLYLYEKALEGDVLAQIKLGSTMVYESDIPKVRLRGIDWLRKAAQSGSAEAQHELEICLLTSSPPFRTGRKSMPLRTKTIFGIGSTRSWTA